MTSHGKYRVNQSIRSLPGIAIAFLFALVLPVSTLMGDEAKTRLPPANNKPPTGSIAGRVVYQADAERPWRYARYYVKDRHAGHLAEAVVALESVAEQRGPSEKAATLVVDQKDFQFTPETAAIRAGDRVKFLNSDSATHNVQTFHQKHSFNINMPPEGTHVETFHEAGGINQPYRMGCVYHSSMRAWIYVFDHPHYQVTKTDGHFHLKNVPEGEYTLQMVHPAGRLRWSQRVKVEADETTQLEIVVSPDHKPQNRLQ